MTPAATPASLDARRRRGQLPAEVTGFVGRDEELGRIAALLGTARLVTVVGPGGVGKTRVALRAVARAADRYPDGTWLVELSGLRDPALLPTAVANCLGLRVQDARTQLGAVLDHLRGRRVLLILDTCEHLVDACALFAEAVLRQTAEITLLATSRQPLDIPGEHTFRLSPLPVPSPGDASRGMPLAGSGDAVELFAQRAASAVPGFAVTAANQADVIRLCQRLDGIPLAIELAAVRLRALPLTELAERLESRFQVLTGGRRGTVPRHQTLRTAIEWSYGLCTQAERALWDRLSVFTGSFDVAAAEEVGSCDLVPRDQVVRVLVSLVDKSVVLRDGPDGPVSTRYRLLDSLREFAAERLAESGQEADSRRRHVARYLAMARYFGRHVAGDDQLQRLSQLRLEHANIRAALDYAFADPALEPDAAALACVLYAYWHISGSLREGAYWLDKVLGRFTAPSPARACALIDRGLVSGIQGQPEAVARAREGTEMAAALGEDRLVARGYLAQNLALTFAGHHLEAVEAGARAERLLTALGSRAGLLCLDAQMGTLHQLMGNFDLAAERCERGLRGLGPGERWLRGYLNVVYALALYQQPGKEADCAAVVREALRAKHELGDFFGSAYALEVLAWLAADAGRDRRAAWLLGAAQPLWERAGGRLSGIAIMEQFHQRAASRAASALGAERYDALHAAGAARPLDEIIPLAVGDADELTAGSGDRQSPGGLTNREQEIAALVASGLSNREIAEKLVISKRTVDAHVDHIFAKLGISSRVQLTVWLRDQLPRARSGVLSPAAHA